MVCSTPPASGESSGEQRAEVDAAEDDHVEQEAGGHDRGAAPPVRPQPRGAFGDVGPRGGCSDRGSNEADEEQKDRRGHCGRCRRRSSSATSPISRRDPPAPPYGFSTITISAKTAEDVQELPGRARQSADPATEHLHDGLRRGKPSCSSRHARVEVTRGSGRCAPASSSKTLMPREKRNLAGPALRGTASVTT